MPDTLTITDNRTGRTYEVPIAYGTYREDGAYIPGSDLRKIKATAEDYGLLSYDPAFMNTASTKSAITFIDGEKGILRYRGYDIADLAENSNYLEGAYLTLFGELPTPEQLEDWVSRVEEHAGVPDNIKRVIEGFERDAHPMAMLMSTVAALSTFYPEARNVSDPLIRHRQIVRLVAKLPTLAAYAYRYSKGLPYIAPDASLSFTGNFLNMMFGSPDRPYESNPVLERALEVLFILHLDHEQNCSANAMRNVGSSQADPYVSVGAAVAALYGPLHGGANEQVLRMLNEIGSPDRAAEFVDRAKRGEFRLMGFGHRVYKNYDPRAKFLKQMAEQVLEVTGRSPLLDLAMELERIALEDEYFVKRKLYPNVDFYSGIIYQAMGFPVAMFPVLFAIPRVAGWLAQWEELLNDPEQKIARPRQVYTGADERPYTGLDERKGVEVELGF